MVIIDNSKHICPNCGCDDVTDDCEVVIRDSDNTELGVVGCCIEFMEAPSEFQYCPICGTFLGHKVLWQDITVDRIVGCDFCLTFEKAGDRWGSFANFEYDIDDE